MQRNANRLSSTSMSTLWTGATSLASFPHYGTGVPLAAAAEALTTPCGSPSLAAIVLTRV